MSAHPLPLTGDDSAYRLSAGQKVLNRYVLQRILGRGGMGVVWLARDESLELDVALKFVPSLVVNDLVSLTELKRETRRNLALTHPNIIRTYDFVQSGSLAGISMEYVDSDTLRNRRLDQPSGLFEPAGLGDWTLQLTDALQYAHQSASIVHRDLKPANLLINGRKQLKVADFGIARSLGEAATQASGRNASLGTLSYMSPQQLDGDPADPLDDIYAVGATLYELCTSRPPFYSGDLTRQIVLKAAPSMAARRAELGLPAGKLPQNWETTIAACLAKERADRPQSAAEIAARLGLRTAASVRGPGASKPLPLVPVVQKVAVTPLKPIVAAVPVVPPSRLEWRFPYRETCERHGRSAVAAVRRNGHLALALAVGLLLAVLVIAFWPKGAERGDNQQASRADAGGKTAGARAAAADTRGGIFVDTEPTGALVQVDGQPPEKTPVLLKNLTTGSHPISVQMDGYEDYGAVVLVKANQMAEPGKIRLALQSGRLNVTTNPPGAEIVVRGPGAANPDLRYTSPWNSDRLPVGEYEISATRPGWAPVAQKVSLARNQSLPVAFELTGGTVQINSVPPKATVLIDGKPVGVTPCMLQDVQPGAIKYALSYDGYSQAEVEGKVEAEQTLTLDAQLVSNKTTTAAAASGADASPTPTPGARSSRSRKGDGENTRRTTRSKGKKEPENDFLNRLKNLPIPFWRH